MLGGLSVGPYRNGLKIAEAPDTGFILGETRELRS